MDILTILGFILALVAVLGGSILKGSGVGALWNGAAFVIVVIGTLAAISVQTRLSVFIHAFRIAPWAFFAPRIDAGSMIERIVGWSQVARKEGLLGLEVQAEEESDEFVRKGLQLLVDGAEPTTIRDILEVDISTREHFDTQAAKVFEGMGIYAPTLGIIGAVMGLMMVMQNLNDPSMLGPGIAAAFVATIYGIGTANLVCLPLANKLKSVVQSNTAFREMVVEGLIAIAEGENPRSIESKLKGFLH